jgi:hypothetical protein
VRSVEAPATRKEVTMGDDKKGEDRPGFGGEAHRTENNDPPRKTPPAREAEREAIEEHNAEVERSPERK